MRVQLLLSTERGITLTRRGQELAQFLANLDESLYAITTGVREDTPDAEATVRVSITNGLNALFLVPNMQAFSDKNPNTRLHTKSILSLNDVRENQTDMMLAFVPPDSRSDLVVERIGTIHYRPLASKTYVAVNGLPTKDNLKHHKFLQSYLYESNPDIWGDWHDLVALASLHVGERQHAVGVSKVGIELDRFLQFVLHRLQPLVIAAKSGRALSLR